MSVAMVAVSPVGGRLAGRRGPREPAAAGLALLTASTAALAVMGGEPSTAGLAVALLAAGIGLGLAGAPLQSAAVESVDARDAGVASGLFSTGRYMGSIVSAGLIAVLLGHGAGHPAALFTVTAAAALAATVMALRLSSTGSVAGRAAGIRERRPGLGDEAPVVSS
jgi:MFS family permease